MKTHFKVVKPVYLSVLYVLICLAYGLSLRILNMPVEFLTLMMVPLIWAVFYYSLILCILLLGFYGLMTVGFIYISAEPFGSTLVTMLISIFAFTVAIFLIDSIVSKQHQLEDAVDQAKKELDTIQANTTDGLWNLNLVTGELKLNPKAMQFLGMSEPVVKIPLEKLKIAADFFDTFPAIHPQDADTVQQGLTSFIEGEQAEYTFEYRVKQADREFHWISAHGKITEKDENGNAVNITGSLIDIDRQKTAEAALTICESRYRFLIEKQTQAVVLIDNKGRINYANLATERLFGVNLDAMTGKIISECIDENELSRLESGSGKKIQEMEGVFELEITCSDATQKRIHVSASTISTDAGQFIGTVWTIRDATQKIEAQQSSSALMDPLTGLYNKNYFENEIDQLELKQASPVSFIVVDLDQFKIVKETLGLETGEDLLKAMAQVLQNSLRKSDTIARINKDQFAIILPGVEPEILQEVMNRIEANAQYANEVSDKKYLIKFSMGSETNFTGQGLRSTIDKANADMFHEKRLKQKNI
jgi:diguanylate cyclase (GGDEF)-like protein/PAS domain S-box-containing protein